METNGHSLLNRLHDYQRLSGILWIAIGVLQIMSICVLFIFGIPTALVGIWNIYAGITHMKVAPHILAGDASIPAQFESMNGLIMIGIMNLVFGGVIGIVFVILDFYVRDQILANRRLFTATLTVA